jgi:hypothetical protein
MRIFCQESSVLFQLRCQIERSTLSAKTQVCGITIPT